MWIWLFYSSEKFFHIVFACIAPNAVMQQSRWQIGLANPKAFTKTRSIQAGCLEQVRVTRAYFPGKLFDFCIYKDRPLKN